MRPPERLRQAMISQRRNVLMIYLQLKALGPPASCRRLAVPVKSGRARGTLQEHRPLPTRAGSRLKQAMNSPPDSAPGLGTEAEEIGGIGLGVDFRFDPPRQRAQDGVEARAVSGHLAEPVDDDPDRHSAFVP